MAFSIKNTAHWDTQEIFSAMSLHGAAPQLSSQHSHTTLELKVLPSPLRNHYGSIPCPRARLHSTSLRMQQNPTPPLLRQRYFLLPDKCSLSCSSQQCNDDIQWWARFISRTGKIPEDISRCMPAQSGCWGHQHRPRVKNTWARHRTLCSKPGWHRTQASAYREPPPSHSKGWTLLTQGSASKKGFHHEWNHTDHVHNISTFQKLGKPLVCPWQWNLQRRF